MSKRTPAVYFYLRRGPRALAVVNLPVRCLAFDSCLQLPLASDWRPSLLVERARLRCPVATGPRLCPATSQPACQHRTADTRAFRPRPAGRLPFTDFSSRERGMNMAAPRMADYKGISGALVRVSRALSVRRIAATAAARQFRRIASGTAAHTNRRARGAARAYPSRRSHHPARRRSRRLREWRRAGGRR